MIVTRNGKSMDLPITQEQLDRWHNGELIQNVFPHLSANEREFIKTGITADKWEAIFKPKKP